MLAYSNLAYVEPCHPGVGQSLGSTGVQTIRWCNFYFRKIDILGPRQPFSGTERGRFCCAIRCGAPNV